MRALHYAPVFGAFGAFELNIARLVGFDQSY